VFQSCRQAKCARIEAKCPAATSYGGPEPRGSDCDATNPASALLGNTHLGYICRQIWADGGFIWEMSDKLVFGGRQRDRHGRLLAHLYGANGEWLQGELLEAGLARVYSFADNRALITEMLALEAEARAAGRGIWAEPYYRIRTPDEAATHVGSFQLVEGRVVDAALVKGKAYLNFGADWRTDFTVALPASALKLFATAGLDPEAFEGRILRVRGWIKSFNGPMIEATHPEQIEVLS